MHRSGMAVPFSGASNRTTNRYQFTRTKPATNSCFFVSICGSCLRMWRNHHSVAGRWSLGDCHEGCPTERVARIQWAVFSLRV